MPKYLENYKLVCEMMEIHMFMIKLDSSNLIPPLGWMVLVWLMQRCVSAKSEVHDQIMVPDRRIQGGGDGAPPGALREGQGGGTIWLNNCQKHV